MNQEQLKEKIAKIILIQTANEGLINDTVGAILSLFSQSQAEPMGISQWREMGKKYGYWDYFIKEVFAEQVKVIEGLKYTSEQIEDIGNSWIGHPCQGYNQALSQVLSILKEKQ